MFARPDSTHFDLQTAPQPGPHPSVALSKILISSSTPSLPTCCFLQGLTSLRHLDLQSNQLARLEELNLLRKYVCCLTHLDLRGNPLSKAPSYTPLTLRRLPHLATLDGHTLGGDEWESAAASHGLLTIPLLEECSSTRLCSIWSTAGECDVACRVSPAKSAADCKSKIILVS